MFATVALLAASMQSVGQAPIALHPDNPHVFLFRGAPTVLITGTEHYGAVLNLDFDYQPYLDELARCGLNLTRTFSGAYMEHPEAFNIAQNTLAPHLGRLICPWARSGLDGYAAGGNKFDLEAWDEAYFERLRDFLTQASERGIVVEYVFFCPFYGDEQWNLSPMNTRNNVQGLGAIDRLQAYTMSDAALQSVQEALVRKVVAELAEFDNLYYEIANEPYFGGITLEWQHRIADVIAEEERRLGVRHLIAQNIANGSEEVTEPHPELSILNFHYATPPTAVEVNYDLGLAIIDDETGFRGQDDFTYRSEAWQFMLAGGSGFDHLDYSFSPEQEDGSFDYPDGQPGGGSRALREQLGFLRRFLEGFDLPRMGPEAGLLGDLPEGVVGRALSDGGEAYAAYLEGRGPVNLTLALPEGRYRLEWLSPVTGERIGRAIRLTSDGEASVISPGFEQDIALRVLRF